MNEATKQSIFSAVRTGLAIIGGFLVGRGVVSEGLAQEITTGVMVVLPLVWGIYDKIRSEAKTKEREAVAVNVGIAVADRTQGVTPAVHPDQVPQVIEAFSAVAPSAERPPLPVSPSAPIVASTFQQAPPAKP